MKRGPLLLVALVAVATAVPLGQAVYDRSAPPRMTLTLSQGELMADWRRDENTGVRLGWAWGRAPELDSLSRADLERMGLRCEREGYRCAREATRRGWIVVGLDSVGWRRRVDSIRAVIDSIRAVIPEDSAEGRGLRDQVQQMKRAVLQESRLRVLDIGTDPAALAERWGDGHLVLAARIYAFRETWPADTLRGGVERFRVHADPLPADLYLPNEWAPLVEDSTGYRDRVYRVTVAVGRGWLPRVAEVAAAPRPWE